MSTRATYKFKDNGTTGTEVTFYIHHDGYPKGAADYFKAMLNQDMLPNQGLAERFCRANEKAEFTPGHEYHGDTMYRYDISSYGDVTAMNMNRYTEGEFQDFFTGSLEEFIEKYGDN